MRECRGVALHLGEKRKRDIQKQKTTNEETKIHKHKEKDYLKGCRVLETPCLYNSNKDWLFSEAFITYKC